MAGFLNQAQISDPTDQTADTGAQGSLNQTGVLLGSDSKQTQEPSQVLGNLPSLEKPPATDTLRQPGNGGLDGQAPGFGRGKSHH